MTEELPKRDQVKALIEKGGYNREMIAAELSMSVASVSSQFTYLRWMGNFIIFDEDKALSMVDEATYNEWKAAKASKSGAKKAAASTKTPAEQYKALAKTIGVEKKQLEVWTTKLAKINVDIEAMPDDDELKEMLAEADAMCTLLGLKVKRNEAKLATMPEPEEEAVVEQAEEELDDESDATDDDII